MNFKLGDQKNDSKNMQIAIARHGETNLNNQRRFQSKTDEPVNELGRKQAAALAIWATKFNPTSILSSPLLRARQTAEIVAASLGLDVQLDERLREREASSEYEGLPIDQIVEIRKRAGHFFIDPTQDWEGVQSVEPDAEVFQRFIAAVTLKPEAHDERILVVAHAGVAKSVFHKLFSIPSHRDCVLKIRNGGVILLNRKPSNEWAFLELWNPI